MNGLNNPPSGVQKFNIAIHFAPGARGDFLASVLLDQWRQRLNNTALYNPNYLKIHWFTEKQIPEFGYTTIRITDNKSIANIMQISYNHFLKNEKNLMEDRIDHFYIHTAGTIRRTKQDAESAYAYDYVVDFSNLSSIEWLKKFRLTVRGTAIPDQLLYPIQLNITNQKSWRDDPVLVKLSELIDFENRQNLFNHQRSFSIWEYMAHNDSSTLLTIKNYTE